MSELFGMIFIGLLTHQQKQAGYFVSQDQDFIYLFHRNDGNPQLKAVFNYDTVTIKEIRDKAENCMEIASNAVSLIGCWNNCPSQG